MIYMLLSVGSDSCYPGAGETPAFLRPVCHSERLFPGSFSWLEGQYSRVPLSLERKLKNQSQRHLPRKFLQKKVV